MPNPPGDDLSEMLTELAESQKRQEAELTELSGATHNPPPLDLDEPFDAALAEETAAIAPPQSPPENAAPAPDPVDEDAIATERIDPPHPHRPVDDLAEIQHEHDGEAADMLAALAQQTGQDAPISNDAPILFAEDSSQNPQASQGPQSLGGANTSTPRSLPTPQPGRAATTPSARRSARTPAKPAANLKAVFAPVFLTLGVLMLLPAVWAVLILMGKKVMMHDAQDVSTMAKIMLACWPVGLGLLAGGVMSIVQLKRENAKQRERDEALAARRRA